jgi:hypothetical protein
MLRFNYDNGLSAHVLAALDHSETRAQALAHPPLPALPAPRSGAVLEPNEHIMCIDHLYWRTSLGARSWSNC